MFGGELEIARRLCTIDIEFGILGALHLNLAFDEIGIVDVKTQQAHALAIG